MLNSFCNLIIHNKNLLMLITVAIYVLALFATLSENLLSVTICLFAFFIYVLYKKYLPTKYILVWIFLFYIGFFNTTFRLRDVDELLNLAPLNSEITGTIASIPQKISVDKVRFFFNVDKIKFDSEEITFENEKVLVTLDSNSLEQSLKVFDSGKINGRLASPFKAGNPSQFDYGNYLRNYNTYAVFYAKSFEKTEGKLSLVAQFLQRINDYREQVLLVHSKYLKTPNLEILGGIVFGDDAVTPPKNIKQSFVNSGLLHILAASGMNVAFIYGFFFSLLSIFRINFKLKIVVSMAMVILYTLMTGLGASVIRATGMILFVLVGKLIDRDAHSISLLSFVGLLMLIYNPLFINDVGFQLSFIVTIGILLMATAITRLNNKVLDYILGVVTIPIIAQLWVIPIQIFYFSNISLYAIFANIMSVPILAILSFGGFISALLSIINPISDFVCRIFDLLLNPLITMLINISDFWGQLPNSAIQTSHPNVFQIILYYALLLCVCGILYKDFREKYFRKLVSTFIILFVILMLTLITFNNKNLEITVFDVGNADCFLIKTPENRYVMIDTGKAGYKGGKSQAEIVVLKYLRDRGVKELEALFITHFDNDHCGGAVALLNTLKINNLFLNDLYHDSYSAKEIYKIAKNKNVRIVKAENNQIAYAEKDLILTNYLPEKTSSDNENSVVSLLNYKGKTVLFTGDAGENSLKEILKYLPSGIDVLKVPHHGAVGGLNKEIIKYLNPKISIISVGENKFGHPAQYILKILESSILLRTDIDNSILIKVNDKDLKIYSYDIKHRRYLIKKIPSERTRG